MQSVSLPILSKAMSPNISHVTCGLSKFVRGIAANVEDLAMDEKAEVGRGSA